jgi:hypothetical protein
MIEVRQWDGGTVAGAGVYSGLPLEQYHGNPEICPGPSISSSGLRQIWADGAASYFWTSPYNPHRKPQEQKDCFDLGRAAHFLILGESSFRRHFAVRPVQWLDWRRKDAQEWREEQRTAGLTVLTPADLETIRGMAGVLPGQKAMPESGLANSRLIKQGLLQGLVEHSLIWRDPEAGVWCRARPDIVRLADCVIPVDFKTIATASPSKALWDYGYHAQGAMVRDGLLHVAGLEMTAFVLVFVQSRPPFRVTVHELTPYEHPVTGEMIDPIALGAAQNRSALRTFATCLAAGEWPAGDGKAVEERMPEWLRHAIETRTEEQERMAA